jgi:cAMP-dependent protein kinase regulator
MGCGAGTAKPIPQATANSSAAPAPEAKTSKDATADTTGQASATKTESVPSKEAGSAQGGYSAAEAAPVAKAAEAAPAAKADQAAEEEDSDDQELQGDDEAFEQEMEARRSVQTGPRKTRMAVSSEKRTRDVNWKAPVFNKTADQEDRLTQALMKSFMFSMLAGDDLQTVIKAFQEISLKKDEVVIKQGDKVADDCPALFVFEKGKLLVFKDTSEGKDQVNSYTEAGAYFGELALLYDAPRAATVVADEDSLCWGIDRATYENLVKDAARTAMENRKKFVDEVPILKGLDSEEKAKICDVLRSRLVKKDDVIIREGDVGTEFFILESGKLEARKGDQKVLDYSPKDYFGELALLRKANRAATVVATETSKVLSLDAKSFERIIGNLAEILEKRAEAYKGVEVPGGAAK